MLIYGKNVAKEIDLDQIEKVYLSDTFKDQDILKKLKQKNIIRRSNNDLDKMIKANHQGIILQVKDFYYSSLEDLLTKDNSFLVMLDHLEDPHNFGAIIRSAEAAGVDGIIIAKNRSVNVNETVMKTSAGALNNIKVAMVTNLVSTIKTLKEENFTVIGTDMEGTDYKKLDYKNKTCLVIGNEAKGMSRLVRENLDLVATIKMKGSINSLNASVAAAIILFEASYQRK